MTTMLNAVERLGHCCCNVVACFEGKKKTNLYGAGFSYPKILKNLA